MKEPALPAVKTLFALSGNVCAFHDEDGRLPACEQRLTDPSWKRVMGEICHIYGEKQGSARWDAAHDDDGHEYWNLILLCPTHHTVIDDTEPDRFTVDKLRRMKEAAAAANQPLPDGTTWCDDNALEAISAAALQTYRRLTGSPRPTLAEDPHSASGNNLPQIRSELAYHEGWARELAAEFREDGLHSGDIARMQHHQTEAARLRSLVARE